MRILSIKFGIAYTNMELKMPLHYCH